MRPQCCNLSLLVPSSCKVAVVAEVLMILYRWLQSVLVLIQPTLPSWSWQPSMVNGSVLGLSLLSTCHYVWGSQCHQRPWPRLLFSNYMEGFPFLVSNGMKCGTMSQAQESPCTNASLKAALGVFEKPQVSICLVWSKSRGQDLTLKWQPWSWISILRVAGTMEGLEQRREWFSEVEGQRKKGRS